MKKANCCGGYVTKRFFYSIIFGIPGIIFLWGLVGFLTNSLEKVEAVLFGGEYFSFVFAIVVVIILAVICTMLVLVFLAQDDD